MPEFIAVKCCNDGHCGLFQVVQKRKDNKWQCRLCNQKQSVQKIYAVSFKASDLRPVVQDYNMKKADTDRKQEEIKIQQRRIAEELLEEEANAILNGNYPSQSTDDHQDEQPKQSRWSKYLEPETYVYDEDEEDDSRYTTVAPQGKRKVGKQSSRTAKKPNNFEEPTAIPQTNTPSSGNPQPYETSSLPAYNSVQTAPSATPTFSRKYNQIFQSNSNDSDEEDSTPLFQSSTIPPKPHSITQPTYGSKGPHINTSTSTLSKPSMKYQPSAVPTSSGSRWSKYIEDNNDPEDDSDDDNQYVTASVAIDSRYQVVKDPEEDEE